ncbi:hypothetical protein LCGC14_1346580 [marine sediment metagenome]|uniref:Uncharacterized protein n=1 Tax=marine sediment metagenome TaxID=412755 RepID=A0A0F9KC82_9ZZZZ
MNEDITQKLDQYEFELEKIINREMPLRDPSISVIHLSKENIVEGYNQYLTILERLKVKFSNWEYKLLNIEKKFFEILKKRRDIEKQQFVKTTERATFKNDLKNSIKKDLMDGIQNEVYLLKEKCKHEGNPPFLVLLNMHSTYPYIQTKDVISRVINEKGVYIIILYVSDIKHQLGEIESYRYGNYMVHSYFLF